MKKIIKIIIILILPFIIWAYVSYPDIGRITFSLSSALEKKLYGLHEAEVGVDGFNYVYLTNQQGNDHREVIIMLHGYTADKDVWPRFAKYFTDNYRVFIPDMAGHGNTGFKRNSNYSITMQSDRIREFMDKLNITSAHIIGNSMGGFITADFAIRYPEQTLSAALINPAGVDAPQKSELLKIYDQGRNPFIVTTDQEFRELYSLSMKQPPFLPGFILDAFSIRHQNRRDEYAIIFEHFFNNKRIGEYKSTVKAPALLLYGKDDRIIHSSSTLAWEEAIPEIQVSILDNIGHIPMLESPKMSAHIYQNFLRTTNAKD